MLLLTIYLFCCLRLSHLRVREERHVTPPAGDDMKAFPYFSIPESAVPRFGPGQWMLVAAGVLGWWIFFRPLRALANVEGGFYDWVLFGLTSVIIAMYTRVLVRFYVSMARTAETAAPKTGAASPALRVYAAAEDL